MRFLDAVKAGEVQIGQAEYSGEHPDAGGELLCKPSGAGKGAAEQKAFRKELKERLAELNAKLCALSDDIGDLQYERLSRRMTFIPRAVGAPAPKS